MLIQGGQKPCNTTRNCLVVFDPQEISLNKYQYRCQRFGVADVIHKVCAYQAGYCIQKISELHGDLPLDYYKVLSVSGFEYIWLILLQSL